MNKRIMTLGIAALMVVSAFAGFTVFANDSGDSPASSGARSAIIYINNAADGTRICDPGASGIPQGNVTWYTTVDMADTANTPEEYSGWGVDQPTNGMYENTGDPYIFQDFGSKLTDWFATETYVMVAEVIPDTDAQGHSDEASVTGYCYVAGHTDVWDGDPKFFATPTVLEPVCDDIANAAGTITWTDFAATTNAVVLSYDVYKGADVTAGTFLSAVGTGVQTYVDGTFVAGDQYYIKITWLGGYTGYAYSPVTIGGGPDAAPVADAGTDQGVNEDVVVTFDGSGSSDDVGIASYDWTFTDGGPQALVGVGPTYTFNTPGVYTVTLTVTDTIGQTDTDDVIITVADVTAPVGAAHADINVNEGDLVTFTDAGSTDNVAVTTYSWAFTDGGAQVLNGDGQTWTFNTFGTYPVVLTVGDAATNTDTVNFDVIVADASVPVVTDLSVGTVAPATGYDIVAQVSDSQTLVLADVELYWRHLPDTPVWQGPVAADSAVSAPINQVTKADVGSELQNTLTYTWGFPAGMGAGAMEYYFVADDGVNVPVPTATETLTIAVAGNEAQPHPVVGYVLDPLGVPLVGATVDITWINGGVTYTNTTLTSGVVGFEGWYQLDLAPENYTTGDPLWVNATYNIAGTDYYGYNFTVVIGGDNILPDDDKEYVNVTIVVQEFFELKWTLGWNIWSIPMLRSENGSLGLNDLPASWFAGEHNNDTAQDAAFTDDCTLVAYVAGAYVTYVHPADLGGPNDFIVTPDNGYWAYVEESWFTDEVTLALPEVGILVPGQYVWRHVATRTIAVGAGWNLLGWTSFNTTYAATDVIMTLTTAAVSGDGVPQPEIIANWTAWNWELGVVADMPHYEGGKDYSTFVWLGAFGQSLPGNDFPVGPGYGFWVYSETGGQNLVYDTQ